MGLLVCYSRSAPNDHAERQAVYLDQTFYEFIFVHCTMARSSFANLSVIASLRYKSPLVVVHDEQLDALAEELDELACQGHVHPQLSELRHVCRIAKEEGYSLSISGDMYPEL